MRFQVMTLAFLLLPFSGLAAPAPKGHHINKGHHTKGHHTKGHHRNNHNDWKRDAMPTDWPDLDPINVPSPHPGGGPGSPPPAPHGPPPRSPFDDDFDDDYD